mmetsp:Transcript_3884/g.24624  ORF Transcript_3884/g.24624 Transcript_3884/m.24624 type:complete len:204 (+) Transcript_3884:157-768(+)
MWTRGYARVAHTTHQLTPPDVLPLPNRQLRQVHEDRSHPMTVIQTYAVAMDHETFLLLAGQAHKTVGRSVHRCPFRRAIIYAAMVVSPSKHPIVVSLHAKLRGHRPLARSNERLVPQLVLGSDFSESVCLLPLQIRHVQVGLLLGEPDALRGKFHVHHANRFPVYLLPAVLQRNHEFPFPGSIQWGEGHKGPPDFALPCFCSR